MPDGTLVTIAGVAVTDSDFAEGGGYLADATGGIAALTDGAAFARGSALLVTGVVDDRYAQRTLRVESAGLAVVGPGVAPQPLPIATGGVDESVEGQLVAMNGIVQGAGVTLTTGEAFDFDDGSGTVRVVVGPATGIDTSAWNAGVTIGLIGVAGQRDSSGTGVEGYRVLPRDDADIAFVLPPPTPPPTPTPEPTTATPSPSPTGPSLVTIAEARAAATGTQLRIRGVVIFPTGLLDESTAVVVDPSGGILVRTGSGVGSLARGQLLELSGVRSTKSGMLSLRISEPPEMLGAQSEPAAVRRSTGAIGESDEATLVVVRGIVRDGPRRTTGGGHSFTVNDGSGAIRVFAPAASGVGTRLVAPGAWIELRAVVGQDTSGDLPNAGYRLWPRDRIDVQVLARPGPGGAANAASTPAQDPNLPGRDASTRNRPHLAPDLGPRPAPTMAAPATTPATEDPPAVPLPGPAPLAAGIGGLAGLVVLAWRHGALRRLAGELERTASRTAARVAGRSPDNGSEESESYTPAP